MKLKSITEAKYVGNPMKLYYFEYYPHYMGTLFRKFETSVDRVDALYNLKQEDSDKAYEEMDKLGESYAFFDIVHEWPSIRKKLSKTGWWADAWEEGSHSLSTKSAEHAKDVLRDWETKMKNGGEWESDWDPEEPDF